MTKSETTTNGKACLTASEFIDLGKDVAPVPVDLPGGGRVYVRGLTAEERDAMEWLYAEASTGKGKSPSIRAFIVAACCCDAEGKPIFDNKLYARSLANMPAKLLEPVFDAARKASGMTEDEVGEIEKNSESAPA